MVFACSVYYKGANLKKIAKFAENKLTVTMYRQIFIPSERNSHVAIPREWYGQEVEVIVSPVMKDTDEEKPPVDYADIQQVRKMASKKDVQKIKKIFANYRFDMKDFKFDRDEANNYD
jgi:hypothetical protein